MSSRSAIVSTGSSHRTALALLLVVPIGVHVLAAQEPDCPSCPAVSVTPDRAYDPDRPKNSNGHTTTFTATNTGSTTLTVSFTTWGTGGVTATNITPSSKVLGPGQQQTLTVTYNVGASGGQIWVNADGETAFDDGYREVTTPPTLTVVLPKSQGSVDTVRTRTPLVRSTYNTTDAAIDTTSLVVALGADTVSTLARRTSRLMEWEVDVAHQLSPGVAKTLFIKICHVNAGCTSVSRPVLLPNDSTPIVSFTGMPLERSGGGAEVETGFAIPAYYSMGAARSAGLVYSTRQSYPRALVNVDIELTWPVGNPDEIKAVLIDGSLRIDSLVATSPICQASTGRRCRITLQGDFSASTYPRAARKWLTVEVRVTAGATAKTSVDSVEAVLVDRRSAPYGSGWFVGGVMRLDSAGTDMILVGPTGSWTLFRGSGGVYLSPPGDRSVLAWTGTQWELRPPRRGSGDNTKVVFDGQGRQTTVTDAYNNATQFWYGTLDRVDSIMDPVYKKTRLYYTTAKLDSIRDPGGRVSRVTINGSNQLVYDSLASPGTNSHVGTFAYTAYGGNNTVVLSSWTDALGQATTVSYDARRRPYRTTLPAVLPETGSTPQSPILDYRAQVLRGLDTLLSADSLFGAAKGPLGNWVRSVVNRWGGPERTWDALGTMSRVTYDAVGRVLWTKGKVADSTRVYVRYDAAGRLIRSYRLRTATDTVLLDSVVYDPTYERVTKRYNALRQATSYTYDNAGSVLKHITPTGDTTRYTYLANGQLSQTKAPLQTAWTSYSYDATWKNDSSVLNPNSVVLIERAFDAWGRDTLSRRKVAVRQSGSTTYYQWRRTRTRYLVSNQVDSTRSEITAECASPCNTPPPWPTQTDTLRWQQVRHAYDRLGRDTARFNTRDKRTRYVYDGLGRLRARYPFADSAAIVDSFRYDLAGRVRYQWTRRGTLLEHRYDSRGRDTLTLVPGVGNYQRLYGGPNDELTRVSIASYSDLIGGVTPAVSWVYSQAGRLLADTAQGGRVTTYQHDRYGRDTLATDVRGTTRYRYDAVRGLLDSVFTAYGDTLRWTVDSQWRRVGPYIANGAAPDFSQVPAWDQAGKLTDVVTTHGAVPVGTWSLPTNDEPYAPDLYLVPLWSEQQGSGGPTVSAVDSLRHDAWGRLTRVRHMTNGSPYLLETFSFDRDGNLTGGGETYDPVTTRLTARAGWTYGYDRAGNLSSRTSGATTWTYEYDALEHLTVVKLNGAVVARYAYDAVGRRIVKRVYPGYSGAAYTRMIYRGDQVVAETDSGGTALTFGYVWGLGVDNLVAVRRYSDSQTWYVVQDLLHNVRGLSRRDGTWVASWRYRVYGAVLDSAGSAPFPLRYRWTGREYDPETGLYYFRARYYDPAVKRFIQEDPIGFAGGVNLYWYGDGNPTNGRDPDGLYKNGEALAGSTLGGFCYGGSRCDPDGGHATWDEWVWIGGGGGAWFPSDAAWAYEQFAKGVAFMGPYAAEIWRRNAASAAGRAAQGQRLTEAQRTALGNFCTLEVAACDAARITDNCGPVSCWGADALTWGGVVNFQHGTNLTRTDRNFIALLAHELTHVVQWHNNAWGYNLSMLWTWSIGLIFNPNPYQLPSHWQSRSFSSFSREQQGAIVELCYAGGPGNAYCSVSPYHP